MNQSIQPGDRVVGPTGHHLIVTEPDPHSEGWWLCRPLYGGPDEPWESESLEIVDPVTVASPAVYTAWVALQDALLAERDRWQHDRGAMEAISDCLGDLDGMREVISDISPTVGDS